jgi:hypothetical protein
MLIFEENSSIGSKHLESCQITEMVGNDWIEIFVKVISMDLICIG